MRKKNKPIRILVKPPGKKAHVEYVANDLHTFQNIVEGFIEAVTLTEDFAVLCNEEGRINGMPYNCSVLGVTFYGPIVFVGTRGEHFCNCPHIDLDRWIDGGSNE